MHLAYFNERKPILPTNEDTVPEVLLLNAQNISNWEEQIRTEWKIQYNLRKLA